MSEGKPVLRIDREDELVKAVNTGKIIVWDGKEPLHTILDGKNVPPQARICTNIKFEKGLTLIRKNHEGKKATYEHIKDLYELLSTAHNLSEEDLLIVESNNKTELLQLVQQLIYLRLFPEVSTREELCRKGLVNCISKSEVRKRLLTRAQNSLKKLENISSPSEEVEEYREEIVSSLSTVKDNLEKLDRKDLNITIFATKKSGKSMVVNLLLKEEIAPTSLELPTPSVIEYIPHRNSTTKVYIGDVKREFSTVKEAREYLRKEFEKISDRKEPSLPPIKILYPDELGSFTIYDTPGPDLAGQQKHKEYVKEYIPKADVAVFVIDYSKHFQEGEEELLKALREQYRDKNFSLIILLNKIDLMFSNTNVDKNLIRAADFIYNKARELGFEDIMVIPISAMYSYYLITVMNSYEELVKNHPEIGENYMDIYESDIGEISDEITNKITNIIDGLLELSEWEEDDLEISRLKELEQIWGEISDISRKIKRLYRIRTLKLPQLKEILGFPAFLRYLNIVITKKAWLEKAYEHVRKVVTGIATVQNYIQNRKALESEAGRIKEVVSDFLKDFEIVNKNALIEINIEIEEFENEIRGVIKGIFNETRTRIREDLKGRLGSVWEALKADLQRVRTGKMDPGSLKEKYEIIEIPSENLKEAFYRTVAGGITQNQSQLERRMEEKYKKKAEEIFNSLSKLVEDLNKELKEKANLDVEYRVPDTTPSLDVAILLKDIQSSLKNMLDLPPIIIDFDEYIEGGFWRWVKKFLGITDERYKIEFEKLEEEYENKVKGIIKKLEQDIERPILKATNILNEEILPGFKEKEIEKWQYFFNSIEEPVKKLSKSLEWKAGKKEIAANFLAWTEERIAPLIEAYNESGCAKENC